MRAVLQHLTENDELGFVGFGQSNRRPWGDRDAEGYVQAPHLQLRAAGTDLTILGIAAAAAGVHGAAGSRSVVSVSEELLPAQDWVGAELRLVAHEWGDATLISLRRGHATVLDSVPSARNTTDLLAGGTFGFDLTNDTVVWPGHGRKNGAQVVFGTSDTLPGLVAGRVYFVRDATEFTFKLCETPFGSIVNLAGGAGIHTVHARAFLVVQWLSEALATTAGVTFSIGAPGIVNHPAHNLPAGSIVSYDVNTPAELTPGQRYFVVAPTADDYSLSATFGGAAIAFAGAGGVSNATPHVLAFAAGYVHLHDRFNSYDNVHVVTPYQPIEPGDYPAGVPVVPGFTLASDVASYADLGLVLPFTWNEGVDGHGASGTAQVAGLVVTFEGGLTVADKVFAGGFIRVGGAKGRVASNTTGTVTVESWTPAAGPGAGVLPFVLWLPHWRNNPHHWTAGEGFLYPSDDMQPGAIFSDGVIYSRPRGRLSASYVGKKLVAGTVSQAVNGSGVARCTTINPGELTVSIVGGKLRIQRATTVHDPEAGQNQFELFLRAGHIVTLAGLGQTPGVDGTWRVDAVGHTTAGAGSFVDLVPFFTDIQSVPGAVAGVVPAGATVTRQVYQRVHKFGSLIESCWRLANAIGRRVIAVHLGVNSSSQFQRFQNAGYGYQGKIGWWDDDLHFDWTPSNAQGLAARLLRMVTFMAPRAVAASLGAAKKWKVLALDGWQGETDALFVAGRELARHTFPTFANWLRAGIEFAGHSPYPKGARIPVQWAQITKDPWELANVPHLPTSTPATTGDVESKVNKALQRFAALDGFAATIVTDTFPKVSVDKAHFNGGGMALAGREVAAALLPLIDRAFQFSLGPDAVALANEALSLIGDAPNVTALEPPGSSTQAKLCAQFLLPARDAVLQAQPWTFATRRVTATALEGEDVSTWAHAYAVPPDLLNVLAVLSPDAADDLQVRATKSVDPRFPTPTATEPASQPHVLETTQEGHRVLRTDQADAVLVYTARNVDFRAWDPLARQACAHRLAHLLAGATLKGKTGTAVAERMLALSEALIARAAAQNVEWQRDVRPAKPCPWLP